MPCYNDFINFISKGHVPYSDLGVFGPFVRPSALTPSSHPNQTYHKHTSYHGLILAHSVSSRNPPPLHKSPRRLRTCPCLLFHLRVHPAKHPVVGRWARRRPPHCIIPTHSCTIPAANMESSGGIALVFIDWIWNEFVEQGCQGTRAMCGIFQKSWTQCKGEEGDYYGAFDGLPRLHGVCGGQGERRKT